MLTKLKERIKQHEGFRNTIYSDSLGFATIGYGHLIKNNEHFEKNKRYTEPEMDKLFEYDFNIACKDADEVLKNCGDQPLEVYGVIIEMCFQLGRPKVLKFKKMLSHIKNNDYKLASQEALNSLWAKQTPRRAQDLAEILANA